MTTPRFDKAKDHGTIHPPYFSAQLYQDGHYFAHDGAYLFSDGDAPNAASTKKAGASAPAVEAEKPTTEPAGAISAPDGTDTADDGEPAPASPADDLKAWARGDLKMAFFAVKKLAAEVYPGIDTTSAATIKAGMAAVSEAERGA